MNDGIFILNEDNCVEFIGKEEKSISFFEMYEWLKDQAQRELDIDNDFHVFPEGDIRHIRGTTIYTVLELHRWLQNQADSFNVRQAINITSPTPSTRINDNMIRIELPLNIDDHACMYLKDGSLENSNGDLYDSVMSIIHKGDFVPNIAKTFYKIGEK